MARAVMLNIQRSVITSAYLVAALLMFNGDCSAGDDSGVISLPDTKIERLVLPFAFSTELTGFSAGIGVLQAGWPHPETVFGVALFGNTQDCLGVLGAGRDLRIPLLSNGRLYSDFDMSVGYYPKQRAYYSFFTPMGVARPGSSTSSDSQYFSGRGWDHWIDLDLKYAMPWGDGSDKATDMFQQESGRVDKNRHFTVGYNPLESGRTWLGLKYARRSIGFDPAPAGSPRSDLSSNSMQFFIRHDGTDKPSDPTRGLKWNAAFRWDPGWADSYTSWTDMQFEGAVHFPIGETDWFQQQVLALDAWTGYSPSFENHVSSGQTTTSHAPPFFTGSTLGGFFRMRAYPSNRFNDKSAVYYSGEYRTTLRWNPATNLKLLRPMEIKWLQLVGFVELGDVAARYDLRDLHRNIKYDAGIGLRLMVKSAVARIDYAVAPHNSGVWFMIGHTF